MDPFSSFFSIQLLFFSFAIFATTFVVRTIVEYVWKDNKSSIFYNKVALPIFPILLGAVAGIFAKMYPSPLGSSVAAREVFSITAGLFSSSIYQIIKGYLKAHFSITINATPSEQPNNMPQQGTMGSDIQPK